MAITGKQLHRVDQYVGKKIIATYSDPQTLALAFEDGDYAIISVEQFSDESRLNFETGFAEYSEVFVQLGMMTKEESAAALERVKKENAATYELMERRKYEELKKKFEGK